MSKDCVAIIGAGVGGLSAAIHLASKGIPVTIYEARDNVGGRANVIASSGYRFDTGPSLLNYPWVFEELFRTAGKNFYDELELIKVDPAIKFVWPDNTYLELSSDLHVLANELERLDPGSSKGLLSFLSDARQKYDIAFSKLVTNNADSAFEWFRGAGLTQLMQLGLTRSMDSQINKHFKSLKVREALGSYAMYLGGSPYDLRGIFSILPFGEIYYGLWLPKNGMYSLIEKMSDLAKSLGVDIRTGEKVVEITTDSNQVTGIRTEGGQFDATSVVSNVDVPTTLLELMADGDASYKTKMTPSVVTFYLGIRNKFPSLNHHTIFLNEHYKKSFELVTGGGTIPDEPPFYVSIPSNTDPDLAPPGCSTIFALVPVPTISRLNRPDWDEIVTSLRSHIFNQLHCQGISIDESDIEFEEVWTPVDWKDHFGLHDGSAFGAAHNLRQIGPFRSPNKSRSVNGLYFVGASTTPGTGVPMCVLSGKMVAERVADDIEC
jgi:phytoene desaturase